MSEVPVRVRKKSQRIEQDNGKKTLDQEQERSALEEKKAKRREANKRYMEKVKERNKLIKEAKKRLEDQVNERISKVMTLDDEKMIGERLDIIERKLDEVIKRIDDRRKE